VEIMSEILENKPKSRSSRRNGSARYWARSSASRRAGWCVAFAVPPRAKCVVPHSGGGVELRLMPVSAIDDVSGHLMADGAMVRVGASRPRRRKLAGARIIGAHG